MAAFDALLHWMGYGLCHQLPERSFFGGGIQVPVCARDTGIYLGVIASVVLISLVHRGSRPTGLPTTAGWATITAMIGVMALDGTTQYLGLRGSTNELRLITGLTSGFAVGAIISPMINDGLWRRSSSERVLNTQAKLGLWLLGVPVCYGLVYWVLPLLGSLYPALVAIGILATLTAVNLVMIAILPPFERKASKIADAWLVLLVSLGVSLLEIGGAGVLRIGILALARSLIS